MNVALLIDADGLRTTAYSIIASALGRHAAEAGPRIVAISPRRPARLDEIFEREKIDLAHFQFAGLDHWGFHRRHRRCPIPFVLSFQSFLPGHLAGRQRDYRRPLSYLVRHAEAITAVSPSCRDAVAAAFPGASRKLRVVPNGIEPCATAPRGAAKGRRLLSVGDLFFIKGTDVLFFALHDLIRRGFDDLRIDICGRDLTGGRMSDLMRRLGLSRHVRLLGPRPHAYVQKLMKDCLFFVSSSREESFGMALVEAMAAGKAVVAPRVGGIPEYVVHEANGLLFKAGDPESLAEAASRLLRAPGLRRRLERAAPRAAGRFHWSRVAPQYFSIYDQAYAQTC